MNKIIQLSIVFICFLFAQGQTQNVGIGTTTPTAKFQINHKNTGSSPSLTLFDSADGTGSKLLFSKQNQGNSFSIVSLIDVLAANGSLDFRTTFNSGILLKGDGKVGINNVSPAARLHVGGGVKVQDTLNVGSDLNLGGNLKVDNNAGTPGQVLGVSASGSTGWVDMYNYNNLASFYYTGRDTSWTVPAGVTKIMVEAWGGGGGGTNGNNGNGFGERGNGGGGGGYVKAYFKNVVPGQSITISIGNGGDGGDADISGDSKSGSPGTATTVTYGSKSIAALGGAGSTFQTPAAGGLATGSAQTSDFGWFFIQGQPGGVKTIRFDQFGSSSFAEITEYGNGGNAGNSNETGSKGGKINKDRATGTQLESYRRYPSLANVPGGGGGGGFLNPSFTGARGGAAGMVIIHY